MRMRVLDKELKSPNSAIVGKHSISQLAIKFVKKQTKKPMASEQKAKNFTNVFFYPETFPSLAVLR